MKIGILTYHRAHNYGAMLQAYALRTLLQDNYHNVQFIDYWPLSHQKQYALFKPILGKDALAKLKNLTINLLTLIRRYLRIRKFERFVQEHLRLSNTIVYHNDQQVISEFYDCIIVGSDQIWRNHITALQHVGFDPVYFCQTLTHPTHCISYAASMGIVDLSKTEELVLNQYLQTFNTILVRENSLKNLVEQLGHSAKVVLDPTLLLTKERWNKLLPHNRYRKQKYILYYELIPSKTARVFAEQKAKSMGCKLLIMDAVIHVLPRFGHIAYASPIEFLHAIRDAEYVIATSFHGTAFSIIFEKQFLSIGLKRNSDRVETLLNNLDITEHYQEYPKEVSAIDYQKVRTKLDLLRQISIEQLHQAINNND